MVVQAEATASVVVQGVKLAQPQTGAASASAVTCDRLGEERELVGLVEVVEVFSSDQSARSGALIAGRRTHSRRPRGTGVDRRWAGPATGPSRVSPRKRDALRPRPYHRPAPDALAWYHRTRPSATEPRGVVQGQQSGSGGRRRAKSLATRSGPSVIRNGYGYGYGG